MSDYLVRFVPHDQVSAYAALGWKRGRWTPGHHGVHSRVMRWTGEGRPIEPLPAAAVCVPVIRSGAVLSLEAIKNAAFDAVIDHCDGNLSEAARLLGVGRSTLYRNRPRRAASANNISAGARRS